MAILEMGCFNTIIGWLFVAFTVLIYALIGVLSRTMQSSQYYVPKEVQAVYNGMATVRIDVRRFYLWPVVYTLRVILIWVS